MGGIRCCGINATVAGHKIVPSDSIIQVNSQTYIVFRLCLTPNEQIGLNGDINEEVYIVLICYTGDVVLHL